MKRHASHGFTLIELIVAVGVFSIASTLITTAFLSLTDTRKTVAAREQIYDEFRIITEQIAREASVARTLQLHSCTGQTCSELRMVVTTREEYTPRLIIYKVAGTQLVKAEQRDFGPCMYRVDETATSANLPAQCFVPITSDTLTLERVGFDVDNNTPTTKPLVQLTARGTIQVQSGSPQPFSYSRAITTQPLGGSLVIKGDDTGPRLTVTRANAVAPSWADLAGTAEDADGVAVIGVYNNDLFESGGGTDPRHFVLWRSGGGGVGTYNSASGIWDALQQVEVNPGISNRLIFYAVDTRANTTTLPYTLDATGLAPITPPQYVLELLIPCQYRLPYDNPPGPRIVARKDTTYGPNELPWSIYRCETTEGNPCDPRSEAAFLEHITDKAADGYYWYGYWDRMPYPSYTAPRTMYCYSARYYSAIHDLYGPWATPVCIAADDTVPFCDELVAAPGGGTGGGEGGEGGGGTTGGGEAGTGGISVGRPPRVGGGGTR